MMVILVKNLNRGCPNLHSLLHFPSFSVFRFRYELLK